MSGQRLIDGKGIQKKSQVVLIYHCRADIAPPTLSISANVVVLKVKNPGFVLNESSTVLFRKVCQIVHFVTCQL
jgi:hypothetical protein